MTCNECIDLLPMLALGEGPIDQRQDLEGHMAACPGCSEQFRRLNEICGVLKEDGQSGDLSEIERMRLESGVYRHLAVGAIGERSGRMRPLNVLLGVAAGLVLFVLGYSARSIVPIQEETKNSVPNNSVELSLVGLDDDWSQGSRFSAAGLKAISLGRGAMLEKLGEVTKTSSVAN